MADVLTPTILAAARAKASHALSMYSLLETAHDYIDRHSDVNRDGDGPNEAMALAASIRELLETIDGGKV